MKTSDFIYRFILIPMFCVVLTGIGVIISEISTGTNTPDYLRIFYGTFSFITIMMTYVVYPISCNLDNKNA